MTTNMEYNDSEFKKWVSSSLESKLDIQVSSINIEMLDFYDDNNDIIIEIKIALTPKRLPKDFMLSLVTVAAKAVRETGETRYPVIKPKLTRGQKVAA